MSTTSTPNYSLVKPDDLESADVAVINGNMDILDSALDALHTDVEAVQTNVDTTNTNATALTTRVTAIEAKNPGAQTEHPIILKSATEGRTSTTAIANDNDFQFACEDGKTYYGELNLAIFDNGDGNGDFQCGWNFPGGRFSMFVDAPDVSFTHGDTVDVMLRRVFRAIAANDAVVNIGVSGTSGVFTIIKFIYVCTSDGIAHFKWAQNSSRTEPIQILQDSFMKLSSFDS